MYNGLHTVAKSGTTEKKHILEVIGFYTFNNMKHALDFLKSKYPGTQVGVTARSLKTSFPLNWENTDQKVIHTLKVTRDNQLMTN